MSKRKQGAKPGKLPLPSPRSPTSLDEKILAHARARAPQRKTQLRPRWVTGMATAAVIAVALFITEPQQQSPRFRNMAPEPGTSSAGQQAPDSQQPAMPSARNIPPPGAGQAALPVGKLDAATNDFEADHDLADDSGVMQAEAIEAAAPERKMAASEEPPGDGQWLRELRRCAELLAQGKEEQARAAYEDLRRACPDCGYPDSLERALTLSGGNTAP